MSNTSPSYAYAATLDRVIDGDTIDVVLDLGFSVLLKARIRLSGIDAPETRTRNIQEKIRGKESMARLIELLGDGSGLVIVSTFYSRGKYGRILGCVFVDGIDVNQVLLDEGHAEPY